MTAVSEPAKARSRGNIRRMRDRVQVRGSAREDPSTGERIILTDSVPIDILGNARSERAALKEAEKLRTKMLADADELKVARTRATVGALLERWMAQREIDATTRMTYESQIRMYIVPAIGDVPLVLFVRDASQRLETLYSRLRKCRMLCNGKTFVERHAEKGPHDCAAAGCKPHVCKPYAASSVRSIHAILSGACSAAVRWGWISFNPMPSVRPPAKPRPQPRPPTSEQMARIVEAAWMSSAEWGLYVWLSAVLGARRGEVVALQWEDVDLVAGVVRLDENYVRTNDGMVLKDTKSHQMRRVSIDAPTVELLRQHREDCAGRLDHVLRLRDGCPGGQVRQDVAAQRREVVEVEVLDRLHRGEVRGADPHDGAGGLAFGDLALQDRGQVLLVRPGLVAGLVGELGPAASDRRGLQDPRQVGQHRPVGPRPAEPPLVSWLLSWAARFRRRSGCRGGRVEVGAEQGVVVGQGA